MSSESQIIPIYYCFYPGNSARLFPDVQSVINVKSDLYDLWKSDNNSVKFEDILADPSDPVKFLWSYRDSSNPEFPDDKVIRDNLHWYRTTDMMEIAKKTATMGSRHKF